MIIYSRIAGFLAVSAMVICGGRVSALNWLLTGFSVFWLLVALILTGMAQTSDRSHKAVIYS